MRNMEKLAETIETKNTPEKDNGISMSDVMGKVMDLYDAMQKIAEQMAITNQDKVVVDDEVQEVETAEEVETDEDEGDDE